MRVIGRVNEQMNNHYRRNGTFIIRWLACLCRSFLRTADISPTYDRGHTDNGQFRPLHKIDRRENKNVCV